MQEAEKPKRPRGRPKKSDESTALSVYLCAKVASGSKKTSAVLEAELLPEVNSDQLPGARWNRYACGDRSMNSTTIQSVYQKAVELGYLPKRRGGFSPDDFGYLAEGRSLAEAKTMVLIARSQDRASLRLVAEARSALRKVKRLLETREDGSWIPCHPKYEEVVEIYDDSVDLKIEEMQYEKYSIFKDLELMDELLTSIKFDSLSTHNDKWLNSL